MENVITLSKLIGLENSKNTRNELARPVMGTIFLVIIHPEKFCSSPVHACYM